MDVKGEGSIKKIKEAQSRIAQSGADLKLVQPQNLHFTVKFFGEISEVEAKRVIDALREVKFKPIRVAYRGMGVFPSPRRISVIWVGVEKGCQSDLFAVADAVEERLRGITRPSDKAFQPHVTISRVKSGRNRDRLMTMVREYENFTFGEDVISSLQLKKSQLTPTGPIYEDVYSFPFEEYEIV